MLLFLELVKAIVEKRVRPNQQLDLPGKASYGRMLTRGNGAFVPTRGVLIPPLLMR